MRACITAGVAVRLEAVCATHTDVAKVATATIPATALHHRTDPIAVTASTSRWDTIEAEPHP